MRAIYILPVLFVVMVTALSSVFIVDERKKGLVLQFGEIMQEKETPGLGWKLPFLQDVVYYEDRILGLQTAPIEVTLLGERRLVVDGLSARFAEAATEKNGTLVRYDILQGLQNLYHATGDETIHELATQLVATEEEIKYRKKYAGVLKGFRF